MIRVLNSARPHLLEKLPQTDRTHPGAAGSFSLQRVRLRFPVVGGFEDSVQSASIQPAVDATENEDPKSGSALHFGGKVGASAKTVHRSWLFKAERERDLDPRVRIGVGVPFGIRVDVRAAGGESWNCRQSKHLEAPKKERGSKWKRSRFER